MDFQQVFFRKGRTVAFLLTATIVFYFGIFCFATPASAHSIDACISLLQNAAQEATSSSDVSQSQLRDDPEQAAHEKDCDEALKNEGLITLTQVRENRDIASLVLNGNIAQDDLDEKAVQRRREELTQREQELLKLRLQICSQADPKIAYVCPQEEVSRRATTLQRAAADANSPSVVGKWEGPYDWPLIPIHVSVGPNGKVLAWQRPKLDAPNIPQYTVWDPLPTNKFTSSPPFGKLGAILTDIFCAGHAFAPSGRLLVAGGHATGITGAGSADTNAFDFTTNKWTTNLPKMNAGRWYPTVTYLPNGEAVVVSGSKDVEKNVNTLPQVWNGTWRDLTTAQNVTPPLYPWMYAAPNGKVFNAGPYPTTRYLDTSGTGSWSTVATSIFGYRYYGTSVMYDDGKVLIAGGSGGGSNKPYTAPTKTAEAIDLNTPNPTWLTVGQMNFERKHHTATLLPDGQVLVTGGTSADSFNKASGKVLPAEIWNPVTTLWTPLASMTVPRLYHSMATLLPDGRVLVGGGGLPKGDGEIPGANITISFCLDKTKPKTEEQQKLCKLLINDGHRDAEIYSPPYLFNPDGSLATRPVIASAPTSVSYGQTLTVQTPDAAAITPDDPNDKVTWIRLPSVTHSFNANQRINRLSFTQTANGLNVTAPSDKNLCPPGHYMLFILKNGVPSTAKIIQII
jgi:hypothetical protein